ncbi:MULTISPECIES: DUF1622 domain-containing protein [unclassified Leifsonia]|uniref:DUF1622 domain-containing protein n=1 Tax=unclassified Leifsonia TaxID=2663824 RepID=UPI0008A73D77|nr:MULTISPECIES: DUF1622 domain-containing protein [unclassified Leifsonia]SEH74057.1 Uncharacterized membrane protein [Leifsonia sp. CL154]SFL35661.1 Uncharacterized membrane protein [Leifsonia sp. CL147]
MDAHALFETTAIAFEFAGVAAMAIGFLVAIGLALYAWRRQRSGRAAFRTLRESFGGVILLGLEILVAADLVRTVTSAPSLTDAFVLGIIVLIRTILSFSLQIEIDGVAPWRRALVTGPEVLTRAARSAARAPEGEAH